jgi:hypothetical protein
MYDSYALLFPLHFKRSYEPALGPVEDMVSNDKPMNHLFCLAPVQRFLGIRSITPTFDIPRVPSLHRTHSSSVPREVPPPTMRNIDITQLHLLYYIV